MAVPAIKSKLRFAVIGMPVVPTDEFSRREAAGQVFAGDAHLAVALRADAVNDHVIMRDQVVMGEVFAVLDVTEKAEIGVGSRALVNFRHRLDFGVIRRDAAAHEPKRGRQPLEHVDLHDVVALRCSASAA